MIQALKNKLRLYWSLVKSLQTGLLLITGLTGYMSAKCPFTHWTTLFGLGGSLLLAISGSTVLNMWYDRDIDARMKRTGWRPLPTGEISPREALLFGLTLSIAGVGWALALNPLYGSVVFAGIFFDVVIYTIWLKRRTAWSIVWGGIAGGMPILAGRVLSTGQFDWIGIVFTLAILFWIPTHILTFSMKYFEDYKNAGVPTFASTYGFGTTRTIITISSILAAAAIGVAAWGIGLTWGYLRVTIVLSAGLLALAARSTLRPSGKINFVLFKYASVYMLLVMVMIVIGVAL